MPVSSTVWCEPVWRSPATALEVEPAVAREQVEHVVEEADAGAARAGAGAVEAERQADVGLARLAADLGGAAHGAGFSRLASIDAAWASKPSARGDRGAGRGERGGRLAGIRTSAMRRRKWRALRPEAKRAAPSVGSAWLEPAR